MQKAMGSSFLSLVLRIVHDLDNFPQIHLHEKEQYKTWGSPDFTVNF